MIPKYFRCNEPSGKCPNSISREIFKEKPGLKNPCADDTCLLHREKVGFIDGLTNGRAKLVYAGAGVLAALIVVLVIANSGNPASELLDELQQRLTPLEEKVTKLESETKGSKSSGRPSVDIKTLEKSLSEHEQSAQKALQSADAVGVATALEGCKRQTATLRSAIAQIDSPDRGGGVAAANARGLVGKLVALDNEAQERIEQILQKSPASAPDFEPFEDSMSRTLARARRLANPGQSESSDPSLQITRKSLDAMLARVGDIQKRLSSFTPPKPPPPLPFKPEAAEMVIGAPKGLVDSLVAPLVAGWTNVEIHSDDQGNVYLVGPQKTLITPLSIEEGFAKLADNEIHLFFASRAPTSQELAKFGPNFRENRSVAEVVALDALTLLAHPESAYDTYKAGEALPLRLSAGEPGSAVRIKAREFGFAVDSASEASGEMGALISPNSLSLGLYHNERNNLRAKRMAVRPTPQTRPLKPSPFTIATEDYLFSFRIVAWTGKSAKEEAMQLVRYATSDAGQQIVSKQGYVDLRLAESQEKVPPEILAALGAAIGSDSISVAIRLSTNFRFEVGESKLDLKAQADLERLPRFVFDKYPTHKVVILGFTDSDGGPQINMPLSKRRAEAIASELSKSKVNCAANGLGPAFPVDTNETAPGKARNRRAEVWVVKP